METIIREPGQSFLSDNLDSMALGILYYYQYEIVNVFFLAKILILYLPRCFTHVFQISDSNYAALSVGSVASVGN